MTDTGIHGGETAGCQGAERVGQRIKQRHAAGHQQECLRNREADIDEPEVLGGFRDPGRQPVHGGSGCLRLDQLQSADTQQRQYSDGQHNDAHAAQPVGQ